MPQDLTAFKEAVAAALAQDPNFARYSGSNTIDGLIDAYTTNDWSRTLDVTGKPFTQEQQQAAFNKAARQLAPGFEATTAMDQATVEDTLGQQRQDLNEFREDEKLAFGIDKNKADQSAADRGVLFAGSRLQKQRDLRDNYQTRDSRAADRTARNIGNTARDFQYRYGNDAAKGLSDMYRIPGQQSFNANVAGGSVKSSNGLSKAYNPRQFDFQGTVPVSQKAATQTRAAGLLKNTANKLTSTGYNNKL